MEPWVKILYSSLDHAPQYFSWNALVIGYRSHMQLLSKDVPSVSDTDSVASNMSTCTLRSQEGQWEGFQ